MVSEPPPLRRRVRARAGRSAGELVADRQATPHRLTSTFGRSLRSRSLAEALIAALLHRSFGSDFLVGLLVDPALAPELGPDLAEPMRRDSCTLVVARPGRIGYGAEDRLDPREFGHEWQGLVPALGAQIDLGRASAAVPQAAPARTTETEARGLDCPRRLIGQSLRVEGDPNSDLPLIGAAPRSCWRSAGRSTGSPPGQAKASGSPVAHRSALPAAPALHRLAPDERECAFAGNRTRRPQADLRRYG